MGTPAGRWNPVSRRKPCPKCGKPDNCEVSRDGAMVWCGRISEGSIRQNHGGQFLHRLRGANNATHSWKPSHVFDFDPPREQARDWGEAAAFYARDAAPRVMALAEELGVSYASLADQGAGWCNHRRCWMFPERNGQGKVIGILTRDQTGKKIQLKGSRRGLSFASSWRAGSGPIFLVEGPSDVAALLTLKLSVIGRPSNRGGVPLLTELLFDVPANREIIVIGERDQKSDGRWPGKEGAISVATQMARILERPIGWSLPPDDAKDSRAWLRSMPMLPYERLADLFVTGLDVKAMAPPITLEIEPEPHEALLIDEWRSSMRDARLQSLQNPAIYLDRSPTGAGKSKADFQAVIQLLRGETVA